MAVALAACGRARRCIVVTCRRIKRTNILRRSATCSAPPNYNARMEETVTALCRFRGRMRGNWRACPLSGDEPIVAARDSLAAHA
jgi:hypothetical protein